MSIRQKVIGFWDWTCNNAKFASGFFTVSIGIIQIESIKNYLLGLNFLGIISSYSVFFILFILLSLFFLYLEQDEFKILKTKSGIDNAKIEQLEGQNKVLSEQISSLESGSELIYNSYSELFESFLRLLFASLELNHEDRISVYKVNNQEGELFELIGRVSDNPLLEKSGRKTYPIDQGFISIGWKKGEFLVYDLPEFTKFEDYYAKVLEYADIEEGVIQKINMKSRNYFVYRLKYNGKPNSVLVFESLSPNKLNDEKIKAKIKEIDSQLKDFVNKRISRDKFYTNALASESGF